jgi:DNA-binding CsgD family transcriptional regulator
LNVRIPPRTVRVALERAPRVPYVGTQALVDAVERVAAVCVELREAHRLGSGPGPGNLVQNSSLHAELVVLLRETLPDPYLLEVRTLYGEALLEMDDCEVPSALTRSWVTVGDYLRLSSEALAVGVEITSETGFDLPAKPSTSIRYAKIASRVSRESAEALLDSCLDLLAHLSKDNLLSPDERRIMRRLAEGRRVAHIAAELNVSERQLHRHLSDLRDRFGASSTIEMVAFAARHGLLDEQPDETG